jgi:hypothetical protein
VGVQVLQDFASQRSALRMILEQMQPLDVPPPSCLETSSYLQVNGIFVMHRQLMFLFLLRNAIHFVVTQVQRIAAMLLPTETQGCAFLTSPQLTSVLLKQITLVPQDGSYAQIFLVSDESCNTFARLLKRCWRMWHGLVPGRDALLDCFRKGRVLEIGWTLHGIVVDMCCGIGQVVSAMSKDICMHSGY